MNSAAPQSVRQYADQLDQEHDGLPTLREMKARLKHKPQGVPLADRDRLIARAVLELIQIRGLLERLVNEGDVE